MYSEILRLPEKLNISYENVLCYCIIWFSRSIAVTIGDNGSLIGRNQLKAFDVSLSTCPVNSITEYNILEEFSNVFLTSLGKFEDPPVKLDINPDVSPISLEERNIAFVFKPQIQQEINKLIRQRILEPIEHLKWTTIVPIMKALFFDTHLWKL